MKLDYSKIVLGNYKEFISDKNLKSLLALAEDLRKKFDYKYKNSIDGTKYEKLMNKAFEYAYINQDNVGKTDYEKAILVNNIVFDNEQFVDILRKGNFDKDNLERFIALVNYVKNNDKADEKYKIVVERFTAKLLIHFQRYLGRIKPEIIINTINEILVYYPSLLENKNNNHTR